MHAADSFIIYVLIEPGWPRKMRNARTLPNVMTRAMFFCAELSAAGCLRVAKKWRSFLRAVYLGIALMV